MAVIKSADIDKIIEGMSKGKDPLEIMREMDRPQIDDTLAKATKALAQAQKAKGRHKCRVCESDACSHNERRDVETQEVFDLPPGDPRCYTGEY